MHLLSKRRQFFCFSCELLNEPVSLSIFFEGVTGPAKLVAGSLPLPLRHGGCDTFVRHRRSVSENDPFWNLHKE